jgi:hypothetical protein
MGTYNLVDRRRPQSHGVPRVEDRPCRLGAGPLGADTCGTVDGTPTSRPVGYPAGSRPIGYPAGKRIGGHTGRPIDGEVTAGWVGDDLNARHTPPRAPTRAGHLIVATDGELALLDETLGDVWVVDTVEAATASGAIGASTVATPTVTGYVWKDSLHLVVVGPNGLDVFAFP